MTQLSTKEQMIKNGRYIDPDTGKEEIVTLHLKHEKIAHIDCQTHLEKVGNNAINADGAYICPGLIDMNVALSKNSFNDPQHFAHLSSLTAKSGITTIAPLPTSHIPMDTAFSIKQTCAIAKSHHQLSIAPIAYLTKKDNPQLLSDIEILQKAGARAFCYGNAPIMDTRFLLHALQYCKNSNALIIQNPQDLSLNPNSCATSGQTAAWLGLETIPSCAEDMMVARDIRLAEVTKGSLHFSFITTRRSVELVRQAKKRNINITCGTAPPYFLLNDSATENYNCAARLFPPLRSEDDRLGVCEGLADGTIDVVTSASVPMRSEDKQHPFAQAKPGYRGLETLFPALLTLVSQKIISLGKAITLLTTGPARILGLPDVRLKNGACADLCFFSPHETWCLRDTQTNLEPLTTPFYDFPFHGVVTQTWKEGQKIYQRPA